MKTYLVVEGRSDAILMRPLVSAAEIPSVEIIDGAGRSSAISLGNSIAISRMLPVAILVDADTTDENALAVQRTVFTDLRRYAPPSVKCELFLAVPTLEECLFPKASDFSKMYGVKLTERQQARFERDRKSVIKSFYTVPSATEATTIRHGDMDLQSAKLGWSNPLLVRLFEFLRNGKLSKGRTR